MTRFGRLSTVRLKGPPRVGRRNRAVTVARRGDRVPRNVVARPRPRAANGLDRPDSETCEIPNHQFNGQDDHHHAKLYRFVL